MIVAGAALLMTSGPLFAQTQRGYVDLSGGVTTSTETTSSVFAGQAGVRVARKLFVFGDVGQFHNLQPSTLQPTVDATDALLSTNGILVTGTSRVPAWFSVGGMRYAMPTGHGIEPYLLGGAGLARLTPSGQFIYSSGTLGTTTPSSGEDVTSTLVTMGDFTQPAASTSFMFTAGAGVEVPVAPHVNVDVGYRLSRIDADTPLTAHSFVAGIGYRF